MLYASSLMFKKKNLTYAEHKLCQLWLVIIITKRSKMMTLMMTLKGFNIYLLNGGRSLAEKVMIRFLFDHLQYPVAFGVPLPHRVRIVDELGKYRQ